MSEISATNHSSPRIWLAALASSLVPGWGHHYIGQHHLAYRLFFVDGLLVMGGAATAIWFALDLVKLTVTKGGLVVLMAVNIGLFVYRFLVTLAVIRSRSLDRTRSVGLVGVAVAGFFLLAPHLAAGSLIITQHGLINSVFAESDPTPAPPASTSTTLGMSSTTMWDEISDTTSSTTTIATTTTTNTPPFWDGFDRLNVLLLGADSGAGRTGLRTDTTIVVSIDPASGDAVMISIPRNLSNAPLPEGMGVWDCNCFPDLITHLWDAAEQNPGAFPGPQEPPINAIKGAVSELLGLPIHYYALVTLDGFVGVVDALGGVTIEVPATIIDETYPHENGTVEQVVIERGVQHLDGHLALAYARIRRHSDDFARMHRQRCVLEAVVDQAGPTGILANFGSLAQAIKEHVRTDIPQDRLTDLVDLVPKLDAERFVGLRIGRDYQTGSAPGLTFYDIERIREHTHAIITDPVRAQAELGLDTLDISCTESFD
jgi:polyisoprenyl-teichoic acid--peptidoglycan teichoic acid transferase